jgi:myo-inositol 2-dehydrogenase/D-chiro-inositol 1-dehydrogenase
VRSPRPASAVRIGLVGLGRIGRMHAELLAHQVGRAEIAAVSDVDAGVAERVGEALGVPVAAADELISEDGIDAVGICTSTDSHPDLIVTAAEAGKPIFCEKPISLELDEVDRALDAVREAGVPLQIGFNRRFDPAHRSVRDAVRSGSVGEPQLVRISSRDPVPPPLSYVRTSGGLFLDMTVHDFDMARHLTGSEVVEVFARGAVRIDPTYAEVGDIDTAVVTLRHADGCLTAIDNSRGAAYGYDQRIEVFGSAGMAYSQNPLAHSGAIVTAGGTREPALPSFFAERYARSYVAQWDAFVDAVLGGHHAAPGPADARATLVIGLAARRSHEEGRPIAIDEVAG